MIVKLKVQKLEIPSVIMFQWVHLRIDGRQAESLAMANIVLTTDAKMISHKKLTE
jgi:hypothetical protein